MNRRKVINKEPIQRLKSTLDSYCIRQRMLCCRQIGSIEELRMKHIVD